MVWTMSPSVSRDPEAWGIARQGVGIDHEMIINDPVVIGYTSMVIVFSPNDW